MFDGSEKVCVQGVTGKAGRFHSKRMLEYGTNIVCGTTKSSKNTADTNGIPVAATMNEAVRKYGADTSIIFVPAPFTKEAALEAIDAGIKKLVIITEDVPQHDVLQILSEAREKGTMVIGPNCPGIIIPGVVKIGIMPESAFKPGDYAVVSRSGTLMYEVSNLISKYSSGIKIALGLGGDPVIGTNVSEAFDSIIEMNIDKVVLIGEVGGNDEYIGVKHALDRGYKGRIKVFLVGRTAPRGKVMGHAGAIVNGYEGTIDYKEKLFKGIGIDIAKNIEDIIA
jgi:succinyl-CoA synthetase alpha subunit